MTPPPPPKKQPTNIAESVKARLLNRSRADGIDFNLYLIRYACERLLYRLSISDHAGDFILKGAMLFVAWSDNLLRPTLDLDLLGCGEDSSERFERVFRELAAMDVAEDDGLVFDPNSVRATPIRDAQEYQGKRVVLTAHLGKIQIKIQVDIGIGDIITPRPESLVFPSLLGQPTAELRASTRQTVVAEKFHVMVSLGLLNSRLKDYFDIWVLSRQFTFGAGDLRRALEATFERRRTELPTAIPIALTAAYTKQTRWGAGWEKISRNTAAQGASLEEIIDAIAGFIGPVLQDSSTIGSWPPGGPWEA